MEQDFVCGEHSEAKNIFCETCNNLMCLECLNSHAEKNCKSPISLFHYANKQILPKLKAEFDKFEEDKDKEKERESFEKLIREFIDSSKDIKQQLIQLKSITEKLIDNMEALETLTNIADKASSYYDVIKESLKEKYESMKEAIINKDIKYIIENKGKGHDLKEVIGFYSKQKELIESIKKSINDLLKSKGIEEVTKGLQGLYSSHAILMEYQGNKVTSKFHYGLISSQDDFKVLCKYDIITKKLIPTFPVKHRAAVTQIGNRVFLTGGHNPVVDTVHEFIASKKSLVPKTSMKHARYYHSTHVISSDVFVVLGGYNNEKRNAYCEEYSIYKNKWTALPSLNNARQGAGTLLLEKKYLYAIGGYGSNSTIERLDIIRKNAWIPVNLASNELSIDYSPRAFLISGSEALILSGNNTDEVVGIYDINEGTIKKSEMTTVKDYYYFVNVCTFGSYVYIIGYSGNVVSYNSDTKKFEVIFYPSIYP